MTGNKMIFSFFLKVTCAVLILSTAACKDYRTNLLDGANIVINGFPKTDTLKGKKLDLEILGLNVLYVADTFLIGFKGTGADHFFEIYSLPNLYPCGKYILAGRGPNELLTLQYEDQFQIKNGEITMWISDGAANKRVLFNLTKSIERQETIFDTIIHIPSCNCCFNQNDTLMSLFKYDETNCKQVHYNFKQRRMMSEQTIFKPFPVPPHLRPVFGGYIAAKPERDKYVMAMGDINQINILSNDLKQRFSVSYGEPRDIWEVLNTPDSLRIRYYSSLCCSSDYIYGLYINREARYWGTHGGDVQIHVFDYSGNPVSCFVIPNDIIFFTIDEKHKCIYGVKKTEEIFRYDFKKVT